MHVMRRWRGIVALCLAASIGAWAVSRPQPSPRLSPADVVRTQLNALRHNDEPTPDAGIAVVYAFSSQTDRNQTGSLQHFAAMLHAGYAPMIGNRHIILGKTRVDGALALQPVTVIASDGRSYGYLFVLRRQIGGPHRGCWMTDSVMSQNGGRGQGLSI